MGGATTTKMHFLMSSAMLRASLRQKGVRSSAILPQGSVRRGGLRRWANLNHPSNRKTGVPTKLALLCGVEDRRLPGTPVNCAAHNPALAPYWSVLEWESSRLSPEAERKIKHEVWASRP